MPRPVTRTRILSACAAASAAAVALSFVLSPPTEVNPLGTLGRASAAPPAAVPAAVAPPVAFGVEGVDLARLGYSGPDLTAVTLGSLSTPFSDLPTERAADIRDRIATATPHLRGLHQAKNLLNLSLPRQDQHVRAARLVLAEQEAALEAAAAELADVRAKAAAPAPDQPDEGGPDQVPIQVADTVPGAGEGTPATAPAAAPQDDAAPAGGGDQPRRDQDAPDAPAKPRGQGLGQGQGGPGSQDGKGNPGNGGQGQGQGADRSDQSKGTGGGAGAPSGGGATKNGSGPADKGETDKAKPAKAEAASAPTGVRLVSAPRTGAPADAETGGPSDVGEAPEPSGRPDRTQASEDEPEVEEPEIAADPDASPVAQVSKEVGKQVTQMVVVARAEAAVARADAARAGTAAELTERQERRAAHRAAAAAAEHEVWRIDAHIRWLQNELWLAQRQMPSAGTRLVAAERNAAERQTVEVRGFRVHPSIADSVRQLVDEAAAAGIDLKGRAYRPVSRQIELRRQNCGSSDYDIFEKPSSLCSPPTAIPGRSLHELGLALDFRNGENSITSRRDPAFQWLARHAPSYGLYNMPAEPWHWSVTGQ